MITASLAVILGFIVLVWSAERFIQGAAATALHLGMPPLVVGMVIVGFGTSAPEMVVSAIAALDGNPELALGNALGSNIANIGLVLGATALIAPIAVQSNIVRRELPLMLAVSVLAGFFLWDQRLTRVEGLILLAGILLLVGWTIYSALRGREDRLADETVEELGEEHLPLSRALWLLLLGMVLLVVSSRALVWGASSIASALGVSDLIIGLTVVAIGTSLPELAASIVAARKGEHDIAVGNIVGSNMFNLLAVIGIAATIAPMPEVSPEVFGRDWLTMMGFSIEVL